MNAPTVETERLRLRAHRLRDFDAVATMWGSEDVYRHIGGKPSTREESWARMVRLPGLWALLGYGYWVVEEKATGVFVGEVGFADFKRDLTPSIEGEPEHGWVLAPHAQGKGYATEAVQASLRWLADNTSWRRTSCIIAPENAASIRVAEKAGYREIARTTYKTAPTIVYRREERRPSKSAPDVGFDTRSATP